MTIVETFNSLKKWLEENVCGKITLKLPDDIQNGQKYEPVYVNPAAFVLYVPGKDKLLPDTVSSIPSVCLQLMEGSDNMTEQRRRLNIRLCLSCWNSGTHGKDTYLPRRDPQEAGGISYTRTDDPEIPYARNNEGWRDIWNFTDIVLRELESTEYVAGWKLVKDKLAYGVFTEDGAVWDYYPYWHSWITFSLDAGTTGRIPEAYKDFL